MGKIITKEEFKNVIRPRLISEGKTIVLCHGVFDMDRHYGCFFLLLQLHFTTR